MPPRATLTPLQPGITLKLCLALFPPLSFNKWPLVDVVNNMVEHERKLEYYSPCPLLLRHHFLFFVIDSREETVLGSIPLPSYVIAPVEPDDHINRKYAFKVTVKWH